MSPWLALVALLAIATFAVTVSVLSSRGPDDDKEPETPAPTDPTLSPPEARKVASPQAAPPQAAPTPARRTPAPAPRPESSPPGGSPRSTPQARTPIEAPRLAVPRAPSSFQSFVPDAEDLSESEDDKPTIAIRSADHYDVDALAEGEFDKPGEQR